MDFDQIFRIDRLLSNLKTVQRVDVKCACETVQCMPTSFELEESMLE